jgi:hypothetical protein
MEAPTAIPGVLATTVRVVAGFCSATSMVSVGVVVEVTAGIYRVPSSSAARAVRQFALHLIGCDPRIGAAELSHVRRTECLPLRIAWVSPDKSGDVAAWLDRLARVAPNGPPASKSARPCTWSFSGLRCAEQREVSAAWKRSGTVVTETRTETIRYFRSSADT